MHNFFYALQLFLGNTKNPIYILKIDLIFDSGINSEFFLTRALRYLLRLEIPLAKTSFALGVRLLFIISPEALSASQTYLGVFDICQVTSLDF